MPIQSLIELIPKDGVTSQMKKSSISLDVNPSCFPTLNQMSSIVVSFGLARTYFRLQDTRGMLETNKENYSELVVRKVYFHDLLLLRNNE